MQCGKILETPESVVKVPLVAEEHSSCTVGGRGHSSCTVGGRGTQFPHRWWQHSSCTVGGRRHSSCTSEYWDPVCSQTSDFIKMLRAHNYLLCSPELMYSSSPLIFHCNHCSKYSKMYALRVYCVFVCTLLVKNLQELHQLHSATGRRLMRSRRVVESRVESRERRSSTWMKC